MLKKDIKFIRDDIKRFYLDEYIESDTKKEYYVDLGMPSKSEYALVFATLGDVPIDVKNKTIEKDSITINAKNFDTFAFLNIACHIYDTNITEKKGDELTFDERVELVKELDRRNSEIIDILLKFCTDIDEDINKNKKWKWNKGNVNN